MINYGFIVPLPDEIRSTDSPELADCDKGREFYNNYELKFINYDGQMDMIMFSWCHQLHFLSHWINT